MIPSEINAILLKKTRHFKPIFIYPLWISQDIRIDIYLLGC